MKLLLICSLSLVSLFSYAQDVSLDRADIIYIDRVSGIVDLSCDRSWYTYRCSDSNLRGGNYGRVIVSNGRVDADYVKIQRTGSKYIKGAKFDSARGESTGQFNLWIRSLFQRALLKTGVNEINYTFTKNKLEVLEGTFQVDLTEGSDNVCRRGSLRMSSCPSADVVCRDYFRKYNYCR